MTAAVGDEEPYDPTAAVGDDEPYDPNNDWPGKAQGKPAPAPDVDVMRQHLELLFGGVRCAGMLDGLIEIAYTDGRNDIKHAQLFGLDELDEAAAFGARVNANRGVNVYVGMALRKPDTPRSGRPRKHHVMGTVTVWVDWDDKGKDGKGEGDSASVREKTAFLPPNIIIVTGKHPWTRSQGMWLLDEPIVKIDEIEGLLRSMARSLRGDLAVVNADRVMRLAGSVAWPHKPGRIREQTKLVTSFPMDGDKPREKVYPTDRVVRAFQAKAAEEPERASAGDGPAGPGSSNDDPHAKNPFTGRFDGEALLNSIRPGNWYLPMRDFVAHMVGLGRADYEIRRMTKEYEEPGHQGITVQDIIDRTRKNYNKPNPDQSAEFDFSQNPPKPLSFMSAASIVVEDLECRPWLFGGWMMKGIVSMLVGPGGAGKSMVSIHAALAYAAGREWAGQKVLEPGGAWIWNNEDDLTELQRRVGGTAKHMGIDLTKMPNKLLLGSGVNSKHNPDGRRLMLAVAGERGEVVPTPDVQTVIKIIKDNGIKVFAVDPMVSIHQINENDNGAMNKVMDILLTIASEADCAVVIIHHTAKPGANTVQAGNQNTSRGAISVPGASRVLLTVTQMTEEDAKFLMGEEYDERMRKHCIRIDTGKANMLEPGDDTVFLEKVSISLGNGPGKRLEDDSDKIGGLKVADFSQAQQEAKMREQDRSDRLRSTVADVMKDIAENGDMKLKEVVTRILLQTTEFGKERSLRDWVEAVIPPASSGGVQIGDYLYHRWQSGHQQTATTLIGKRLVP